MAETLGAIYLEDVTVQFRKLKELADRAIARVADSDLFRTLDAEANSIGVLMQHISGNLKSRWTEFLTSDGEKPGRDRDSEFEVSPDTTRERLLARWEEGWECLFRALAELREEDLLRTVSIRAEPHSVPQAIHRQMTHQAYHVGQLVLLAKHFAASSWQSLSVPRGRSRELNQKMFGPARS